MSSRVVTLLHLCPNAFPTTVLQPNVLEPYSPLTNAFIYLFFLRWDWKTRVGWSELECFRFALVKSLLPGSLGFVKEKSWGSIEFMLAYTFPNPAQAMYGVFSDPSVEGLIGSRQKSLQSVGPCLTEASRAFC